MSRVVELDDAVELVRRALRPSMVATPDRRVTQAIARRIFTEGAERPSGWWSAIESSWPNVTLFAERAVTRLALASEPETLSLRHAGLRAAADAIGVRLAR